MASVGERRGSGWQPTSCKASACGTKPNAGNRCVVLVCQNAACFPNASILQPVMVVSVDAEVLPVLQTLPRASPQLTLCPPHVGQSARGGCQQHGGHSHCETLRCVARGCRKKRRPLTRHCETCGCRHSPSSQACVQRCPCNVRHATGLPDLADRRHCRGQRVPINRLEVHW